MNYASFGKRFQAKAIDASLYLVAYIIVYSIAYFVAWEFSKYVALILTFFFLSYNILLIKFYGKTLGKMASKIRVVRNDGSKSGILNSFMRESLNLLYWILTIIKLFVIVQNGFSFIEIIFTTYTTLISIEFFTMFVSRQKKTLHDFIGGTVVITDEVVKYNKPQDPQRMKVKAIEFSLILGLTFFLNLCRKLIKLS